MAKLTLNDITGSRGSKDLYNSNNALIEQALENTLSRDGTTPNAMLADLDLNSNDLLNVGSLHATSLVLNGTDLDARVQEAATSAANALVSENNAKVSETNAANSAANAANSAANAATSALDAATYSSLGLGGAVAFDLGSVVDSIIIFPTDWGTV